MQPALQAANHHDKVELRETLSRDKIKELSTEAMKQYLYGKTIKRDSLNYTMLMELKNRGTNIYTLKQIINYKVEM